MVPFMLTGILARSFGRLRRQALCLALFPLIGLALLVPSAPAWSQGPGDLAVVPSRAVFDGRTRSLELTLLNRGTKTTTYRISMVNRRMLQDGGFEEIEEPGPGERFAEKLVRYAPRQVKLVPGKAQTVRLMVRKQAGLAAGEYRSHLMFQAIPERVQGRSIEQPGAGEGQFRVELIPIFGITIPVIVRHGSLTAGVAVKKLSLAPGAPAGAPVLAFRIERNGDRSVFGDLSVSFVPRDGGSELVLGRLNGVAVYTPNPARRFSLPLRVPNGTKLRAGQLRVSYRARPDEGGAVLASAVLELP